MPVRVTSLENFAVTLSVEAWCRADEPSYPMKCDILLAIKTSFDKAGIRMASPVRKILFEEKEEGDGGENNYSTMYGLESALNWLMVMRRTFSATSSSVQ